MMNEAAPQQTESGVAVKSSATKCPLYPTDEAGPMAKATAPPLISTATAPVWSRPTAIEQTEARFRLSFSRTCQKRGPPSLAS
jgi:hypothetical protein